MTPMTILLLIDIISTFINYFCTIAVTLYIIYCVLHFLLLLLYYI